MSSGQLRKYMYRLVRLLAWVIASLVILVFLVILILQFPASQTYIAGRIASKLSEDTGAVINIERVNIRFPVALSLRGIYIEDPQGDTLLYAGSIHTDIRMTALLQSRLQVNSLEVEDLTAFILREEPDTVFNFQFLVDAFAGKDGKEPGPSGEEGSFSLHINRVFLSKINVRYEDHFSGTLLNTRIGKFQTTLGDSDILNNKFNVGNTVLSDSDIRLTSYEPSFPADEHEGDVAAIDISLASLQINDTGFSLASPDGGRLGLETALLYVVPEQISLRDRRLEISSVRSENLKASMMGPPSNENAVPDSENAADRSPMEMELRFSEIMEWTVDLQSLEILNSSLRMGQENIPFLKESFDPDNFIVENLDLSVRDIFVAPHRLRMSMDELSMTISESFRLDHMDLEVDIGEGSGSIDLVIKTAGSRLGLELAMDADLLNFSLHELMDRDMLLIVEGTSINDDLAFFMPEIGSYYFNHPGTAPVGLSAQITGSASDMAIDSLRITGPEVFSLFLAGDVRGLPEADSLFLDLVDFSLWAAPGELIANVPVLHPPEGMNLPAYINAGGHFRGTASEFITGIQISSDLGDLDLIASMEGSKGHENFEGRLSSPSLDIAGLLQDGPDIPPLSLDLIFRGKGLEPELMELSAELTIGQLTLGTHSYDDIAIELELIDSTATLTTSYRDEFLAMDLNASIGILKEIIPANGKLIIEYAALDRLGLSEEELLLGSDISVDIILDPADFFNGDIIISNTDVAISGERHNIPDIQIISASAQGDYSLELISEFLNASYNGNVSPAVIPEMLSDHLSEYFTIPGSQKGEVAAGPSVTRSDDGYEDTEDRYFNLDVNVFPSDVLSEVLLPGIDEYDTFSAAVSYDSRDRKISLDAEMKEIRYGGVHLRNFEARLLSGHEKMDFGIFLDSLSINGTPIFDFDLSGSFFDEKATFFFSFKDDDRQEIFLVNALLESREGLYHFMLDPENLIINNEDWRVHPGNLIVAGQEYLHFNDFILEGAGGMLSVTSPGDAMEGNGDIIDITLRNLDIHSLTGFAAEIIPITGGILDGDMTIRDLFGETTFTANMKITNLEWSGYEIENITLRANDVVEGRISVEAVIEDEGTALRLGGYYFPGEDPAVDVELVIDRLELQLIEMFAGDELTDVAGIMTGRMNVTGNLASPEITGEMTFTGAAFRIVQLNSAYVLKNEQVSFDRHNLVLRDFTIEDSFGRTASLDGSVNIEDFDNLILNLNFSTRNFLLMDLPERRGAMYHGTILMDTDLRIRGSHNSPSVGGRLRLNEGSSFSFVIPQATPEAIGGEGVVEFISPGEEDFFRKVTERAGADELRSGIEIMTINLNVELDRNAELNVVIDEVAGDYLHLRGGGELAFGIDPGGAISLTGRYDITEGEYMLSFHDVARRRFSIREGSGIVFTGDPMEAELDITAIYTVRTSGEQLLRSTGQADHTGTQRGRSQFPFLVYLNMKGELMAPNISFQLDMPPEHSGAFDGSLMARINAINEDESELNKQVFALLILGNFIHESPFAAGGGSGIASTARTSASQILSQQLNRLSDRYIRGVDISFELESYEVDREDAATGRTELQVEVSRDFFNDRVRVVVGGNIELEDETHRETRPGEIAGDFTLEYLLTPAGNLLLRGFRTREYGDLIEGELTTTGIALVFSRSYNRFRELFRRETEEEMIPRPEEGSENHNVTDGPR